MVQNGKGHTNQMNCQEAFVGITATSLKQVVGINRTQKEND